MPELPEVESLRRGLVKAIVGSRILRVKVLNEKIISGKGAKRYPDETKTREFGKNILSKKIGGIERRAKNLIIQLNTKEILLVHLKMTGQLVFVPKNKREKISFGGASYTRIRNQPPPQAYVYNLYTFQWNTLLQ